MSASGVPLRHSHIKANIAIVGVCSYCKYSTQIPASNRLALAPGRDDNMSYSCVCAPNYSVVEHDQ